MQTDTKIIDNIMSVPTIKRRKLRNDAERHAVAECNGEYYYNEDEKRWEGPQAHKAEKLRQSIINRLYMYSAGILGQVTGRTDISELPDFLTFENDPRGYVVKIETAKLSEEARQYCIDTHLEMDWGGDYTILTTAEVRKLNKMR